MAKKETDQTADLKPGQEQAIMVKIVSNGTAQGTKIVDINTGKELQGVVSVRWGVDAKNQLGICSVDLVNVPVDLKTAAQVRKHEMPQTPKPKGN